MTDDRCPALELDNQLCFAVYSASLAIGKLYKPILRDLGLTYSQYLIMLVLWEEDGVTASHLGQRLTQDLGALSPVIKRLETQGLIRRERSADDDRKIHLRLTEAGRALRDRAESIPERVLCASGLDEAQARRLKSQLEAIRRTLQAL